MKLFSRGLPLLALAMLSVLAFAGSANALTITPVSTAVNGTATDTQFTSSLGTVACTDADALGTTSNPASDKLKLTTVTFAGTCTGPFGTTATVTTSANATTPWSLIALSKSGTITKGAISIPTTVITTTTVTFPDGTSIKSSTIANTNSGFATIVLKLFGGTVCTISVGPQQVGATFNSATTNINVNDDTVAYTQTGSLCSGSGKAVFTGTYATTPANLEVT